MPAEKMRRLRELVKWRKGWGQEDLGVAVFRAELFRRAWDVPEVGVAWNALTLEYGEL